MFLWRSTRKRGCEYVGYWGLEGKGERRNELNENEANNERTRRFKENEGSTHSTLFPPLSLRIGRASHHTVLPSRNPPKTQFLTPNSHSITLHLLPPPPSLPQHPDTLSPSPLPNSPSHTTTFPSPLFNTQHQSKREEQRNNRYNTNNTIGPHSALLIPLRYRDNVPYVR